MRDYGKVYSTFWSSATVMPLSDDGKLLALYLLTCSHSTITGVFRLPDGYVSEDLKWDAERVRKGFTELLANGFANRCETTKWVWIRKHLEWNKPENPNQRKSAAKVALSIPVECCWQQAFARDCAEVLALKPEDFPNRSETVEQPLLNQKQEQKQKQEIDIEPTVLVNEAKKVAYKPPPTPTEDIAALYRKHLPMLPSVEVLNESRKRAVAARWREVCSSEKFDRAQGLEWFGWFFAHVSKSKFLTGQIPGKSGRIWTADFDFLMTASKFPRVVEGVYHKDQS